MSPYIITVKEAAKLLGKSEQFVRIGLQQGKLEFGRAVKNKTKWDYHISKSKLEQYLGINDLKKEG